MENEKANYCPNCGYMIRTKVQFCPNCGYDLRQIGGIKESRQSRYNHSDSDQMQKLDKRQTDKNGSHHGGKLIVAFLTGLLLMIGVVGWFVMTEGNKVTGGDSEKTDVSKKMAVSSKSASKKSASSVSSSSSVSSEEIEKLDPNNLTPEETAASVVEFGSENITDSTNKWTEVWPSVVSSGMIVYVNKFDEVSNDSLSNPGEDNVLYTVKTKSSGNPTDRLFYTLNDGDVSYYTGTFANHKYQIDNLGEAIATVNLKQIIKKINQDSDLIKNVQTVNTEIEDDR